MALRIASIQKDSLANLNGLEKNDIILDINENSINDFLDLQYYGGDPYLKIAIQRGEQTLLIEMEQDWETPLGIIPEDHPCRICINKCIFCFIDQMPPKLRSTLYVKDDDVPFSFTFGNFITLTNLSERDYQRIVTQHLSPLYISVHTTDDILHRKMLRYSRKNFSILERLSFFAEHNIDFHAQIVIVPGFNDDVVLEKTLNDLTHPDLNTLSIGVVPVGITKFRQNLTPIQPVSKESAQDIISLHKKFDKVYLADEFFLLAEEEIPPESYYQDYPQLENGIGMSRMLLENWNYVKEDFITDLKKWDKKIVMVTGKLAISVIKKISDEINNTYPSRVVSVCNDFFGESVTVAGLLTAADIQKQVQIDSDEIVCMSNAIFNNDDVTIDQVHLRELANFFGGKMILVDEEFADWHLIVTN